MPLLAAALLLTGAAAQAQAPAWRWALHSAGMAPVAVQQVTTDAAGNGYVTGRFSQQISLGDFTLRSAGSSDVFIAKFSAAGQWQWAVAAGGAGADMGSSIAVAADGSVTVAGSFAETAQFGLLTKQSRGGDDVFVAVLTPAGDWRAVTTAGGPEQDQATALALDAQQQPVVAGRFRGRAAFGAAALTGTADSDAFVAKLDAQGDWQWARQTSGNEQTVISSLSLDQQDNVYAAGYFAGRAGFGSTHLTSAGTHDAFVAKMSRTGSWQWATAAGGSSTDYAAGVAVSRQGSVFVTGSFSGQADFGGLSLASRGGDDAYVARLSSQGRWQWVQPLQGPALEAGAAVCAGPGESVYVSGQFSTGSRYGAAVAPAALGSTDGFVARLSSEGKWLDFLGTGSAAADQANSLALGPNGEVLVGGTVGVPPAEDALPIQVLRLQLFAGWLAFPVRMTADVY